MNLLPLPLSKCGTGVVVRSRLRTFKAGSIVVNSLATDPNKKIITNDHINILEITKCFFFTFKKKFRMVLAMSGGRASSGSNFLFLKYPRGRLCLCAFLQFSFSSVRDCIFLWLQIYTFYLALRLALSNQQHHRAMV